MPPLSCQHSRFHLARPWSTRKFHFQRSFRTVCLPSRNLTIASIMVGDLNQGILARVHWDPVLVGKKDYSLERAADGYRAADISRQLIPADYGFLDQVWHRLPLVIPGGVAGVLGALVSARSTSGHKSSSSSSIIILTAFEPSSQTSLTSRTSTMTLPSGAVILTIEVITSVQTLTPQATLKSHDFPSYSTTTTDFGLLSTSVVSATPEFASSTARASAFIRGSYSLPITGSELEQIRVIGTAQRSEPTRPPIKCLNCQFFLADLATQYGLTRESCSLSVENQRTCSGINGLLPTFLHLFLKLVQQPSSLGQRMARIIWFERKLFKHCRSSADTFDGENSLEQLHFHVTKNEIG
ncbi:hypothetical protein NA56DRAFT_704160 [Hyaloscypha hepaticicola]|uniref:Uncharacterized protein n=1 Tax=Hyaloscypha hepaticicola TaxID=2082293 RepID=A0A2J6Q3S2_9HELO|nr:hypothetical protein NA56DRAFT_704160 [Hyaloscypha hepaticicola]